MVLFYMAITTSTTDSPVSPLPHGAHESVSHIVAAAHFGGIVGVGEGPGGMAAAGVTRLLADGGFAGQNRRDQGHRRDNRETTGGDEMGHIGALVHHQHHPRIIVGEFQQPSRHVARRGHGGYSRQRGVWLAAHHPHLFRPLEIVPFWCFATVDALSLPRHPMRLHLPKKSYA